MQEVKKWECLKLSAYLYEELVTRDIKLYKCICFTLFS